jgi:hypothetical protein
VYKIVGKVCVYSVGNCQPRLCSENFRVALDNVGPVRRGVGQARSHDKIAQMIDINERPHRQKDKQHTSSPQSTAVPRYISRRSACQTAPETKTLQELFDETSKEPRCAETLGNAYALSVSNLGLCVTNNVALIRRTGRLEWRITITKTLAQSASNAQEIKSDCRGWYFPLASLYYRLGWIRAPYVVQAMISGCILFDDVRVRLHVAAFSSTSQGFKDATSIANFLPGPWFSDAR